MAFEIGYSCFESNYVIPEVSESQVTTYAKQPPNSARSWDFVVVI